MPQMENFYWKVQKEINGFILRFIAFLKTVMYATHLHSKERYQNCVSLTVDGAQTIENQCTEKAGP